MRKFFQLTFLIVFSYILIACSDVSENNEIKSNDSLISNKEKFVEILSSRNYDCNNNICEYVKGSRHNIVNLTDLTIEEKYIKIAGQNLYQINYDIIYNVISESIEINYDIFDSNTDELIVTGRYTYNDFTYTIYEDRMTEKTSHLKNEISIKQLPLMEIDYIISKWENSYFNNNSIDKYSLIKE